MKGQEESMILKAEIFNENGKSVGELNLPEQIFAYPVNTHLLYEAAVHYRDNQRKGTSSTKTRGEVSGSNRKPWRQKGTGRARAGSIRSPLWRKGGIIFGPKPRDYYYSLPKKVKRNALKSALSLKLSEKRLLLLEGLLFNDHKTKNAKRFLETFKLNSALIVDDHENRNLFLAVKNIPRLKAVDHGEINAYEILNYEWLVLTRRAFDSLMERLL